jgi:hypothetical protein
VAAFGLAAFALADDAPPLPRSYALILAGVSGDKQHHDKFWDCATSLYNALRDRCGYSDADILFLFEEKPAEGGQVDAVATLEAVRQAFADLRARLKPDDRLFVFCLGHADRGQGKVRLNLKGPDLTAEEFGGLLDTLPCRCAMVALTMPLSGHFMAHVAKPGRIVITATEAQAELSETVFPYCFVRGFYDAEADANRDGFLSLLELFRYARKGVEAFYREKDLLQTEHPLLNDTGQGRGQRDPDPEKGPNGRKAAEEGFALQQRL